MKNIILKVEFLAGVDIFDAGEEAIALAEKLNVGIKFDFNGILCTVWPGDSPKVLKEQYLIAGEKTEHELRMAFGH